MGLERYLLHDFFTAHEFNKRDEANVRTLRMRRRGLNKQRERDDEQDRQIGRATLFVVALAELVVKKGLCTRDELMAMVRELDYLDGTPDGALAADFLPNPNDPPPPPPPQ